MQHTGPTDYYLADIELWLHEGQKGSTFEVGTVIYQYLKTNSMLAFCLGLADGVAIQNIGMLIFQRFFGNNRLYLWRSVIQSGSGQYVPYICIDNDELVVRWDWLGLKWGANNPAALFPR